MKNDSGNVRFRQDPLRKRYRESPEEAMITDRAITTGGTEFDPFHGKVVPGSKDHGVPVGFKKGRCHVALKAAGGTDPQAVQMLIAASENSCVNYQTLRAAVPITTSTDVSFGGA